MESEIVTVRLPAGVLRRVDRLAKRQGTSRSEVLRGAVLAVTSKRTELAKIDRALRAIRELKSIQ
jgi:metal-responsive CopG/Arc/MetJ family transcriptional regulator